MTLGIEKLNLYNYEVEKRSGRDTDGLTCLFGVYFHCFCDEHDALIYFMDIDETSFKDVKEGVYDVSVYGTKAVLYYWHDKSNPDKICGRGLIVIKGSKAEEDALKKFNVRQNHL